MTYVQWSAQRVIETFAGEDVAWKFQVRDADGTVVNIAGWTFTFYAVDLHDSSNTITVTNGSFTITDAASGEVEFAMPRATTLAQGGKAFRAELWRTNTGAQDCVAAGSWKVRRTVRT
jgi:hypothetical protein